MVGFNVRNKNSLSEVYFCRICTFLLREPVQFSCGHRFCDSCVKEQESVINCNECNCKTMKSETFRDVGMRNDMETLNISCFLCHWAGIFKDYQDHLNTNHSNRQTNRNFIRCLLFQTQQLVKIFQEYSKNFQILKITMNQLVFQTTPDKISVEEQTPTIQFQQIQDGIVPSHGQFIWRIDNIKGLLNDPRCCITSPAFYTSPQGYKMRVCLYLNGDSQSTHVSISLVLMRGDYDAILPWPFNFQVIFCLYDLIDQKNHIIESFQPDTKSKNFQRPKTDMNIECVIPKFVPLSKLLQDNSSYIHDDTAFIKIMIRKDPIPSYALPSIMNINPALPMHIQEQKIQEEIQRHKLPSYKLVLTFKP